MCAFGWQKYGEFFNPPNFSHYFFNIYASLPHSFTFYLFRPLHSFTFYFFTEVDFFVNSKTRGKIKRKRTFLKRNFRVNGEKFMSISENSEDKRFWKIREKESDFLSLLIKKFSHKLRELFTILSWFFRSSKKTILKQIREKKKRICDFFQISFWICDQSIKSLKF